MNKKTCGELLVEILAAYGVDTVFGIPGVHTVELYRGLPNTPIRHITPRHEQGAGFMADGYARASGKVGVCFIITGPGMSNIATAMAQAKADSIPMLVISSVNKIAHTGSGAGHLHELDNQQALVEQVAAYSRTVWSVDTLPEILAEAFNLFDSAKPAPVHIQLPLDIITADASHVQWHISKSHRPAASAQALDQAAACLQAASAPMLLLGGGCVDVPPADIRALAECLDAPTTLSINAKGLLPIGHPLNLGSNATFAPVRKLIAEADVVLAIGTELGQTDYDLYVDGGFNIPATLIRADLDCRQLHRNQVADLGIVGDASSVVQGLIQRLQTQTKQQQGAAKVRTALSQLAADFPPAWAAQNAVLQTVRDCLPEVVMVGDSTQPVYSGNHVYAASRPRAWFNSATGYGTLGYALPAAIGAALAQPHPVVCIAGDGGVQFSLPELMCASELGLPLIVLLWHNQGYGEIRSYMAEQGLPQIGVSIAAPDFALIAQAMQCDFIEPNSSESLQQAILTASRAQRPTLIQIDENADYLQDLARQYPYFAAPSA